MGRKSCRLALLLQSSKVLAVIGLVGASIDRLPLFEHLDEGVGDSVKVLGFNSGRAGSLDRGYGLDPFPRLAVWVKLVLWEWGFSRTCSARGQEQLCTRAPLQLHSSTVHRPPPPNRQDPLIFNSASYLCCLVVTLVHACNVLWPSPMTDYLQYLSLVSIRLWGDQS